MISLLPPAERERKRVQGYPILAASGRPGPKLRQGDLQVPEGVYRLTAFNPNSRYHLSIRVDYPNAHDRKIAAAEGRRNLGGDIFIHGKAVSIGCLAIGDTAIEELYVLLADAGLSRSTLLLAPSAEPRAAPDAPAWITDLYRELRSELGRIRGTWGADLEAVLGRSDEAAADGRPTRHEMIERPKDASVESPSEVP